MNYAWNNKGKALLTEFYEGSLMKRQGILSVNTGAWSKSEKESKSRFNSIDIMRGVIMLLMTLDHVRHFLFQANPFRIWFVAGLYYLAGSDYDIIQAMSMVCTI